MAASSVAIIPVLMVLAALSMFVFSGQWRALGGMALLAVLLFGLLFCGFGVQSAARVHHVVPNAGVVVPEPIIEE